MCNTHKQTTLPPPPQFSTTSLTEDLERERRLLRFLDFLCREWWCMQDSSIDVMYSLNRRRRSDSSVMASHAKSFSIFARTWWTELHFPLKSRSFSACLSPERLRSARTYTMRYPKTIFLIQHTNQGLIHIHMCTQQKSSFTKTRNTSSKEWGKRTRQKKTVSHRQKKYILKNSTMFRQMCLHQE